MKEEGGKAGTLYVVATPIGNLEDITLRAIRTLKEVSLIAAEDTRRTKKLLNVYGIQTPLISLYDQTERSKSRLLISRMEEGQDVAYVSDAGTPGISDPGYILINQAIAAGVRVVPVPGVSAVIAALSVAGLPMDSFVFIGFPPARSSRRRPFLEALKGEMRTLIFYESPRRLFDLLRDMGDILGNRRIVIARELTKMFEEIQRGTLQDIRESLQEKEMKGEVTLIVAGKGKAGPVSSVEDIAPQFLALRKEAGISIKDMVRRITGDTGLPRKKVYQEVLKLLGESPGKAEGENP
jgi:16S rRNA (cytidine1402-2'-O)-methyltransferase